ncbi:putative L-PSP endoribonuclease family protein [Talaromyces proteolyticus]|uniref:L-PSP endoribonuclease family protein n=1 Tax=Talaromyces proteolyticus TaxID=1131652 RepID=A0AAD4PUQ5_9EURO|nr:putative L-PSP endoribonuclease family protein [Talaromyces proteolyticus]KAH8692425.1 putative L-PSP endoribonuclease family protein [Talaromyces proteolyticus]
MTPVFAKDAAPPAGPYSHAIKANGLIFASGCIPCDAAGTILENATIQEKTALSIKNAAAVLEAAGSSIAKVVKVTVFLTDMANFAAMNEEYAKHFTHKPARSCVAVYQLPKGVPVEVEVVALE